MFVNTVVHNFQLDCYHTSTFKQTCMRLSKHGAIQSIPTPMSHITLMLTTDWGQRVLLLPVPASRRCYSPPKAARGEVRTSQQPYLSRCGHQWQHGVGCWPRQTRAESSAVDLWHWRWDLHHWILKYMRSRFGGIKCVCVHLLVHVSIYEIQRPIRIRTESVSAE